jgi:hypothetical protein
MNGTLLIPEWEPGMWDGKQWNLPTGTEILSYGRIKWNGPEGIGQWIPLLGALRMYVTVEEGWDKRAQIPRPKK